MKARARAPFGRLVHVQPPGGRGYDGPAGGANLWLHAPTQRRGTTAQVQGLYPFVAGGGAPLIGAPVGKTLRDGGATSVCCDPISWFERARLIHQPSQFVLGLPALGKSTLVRRQILGLAGYGVLPMVLGDVKGEYVDLIAALGGQVVQLGRGRGHLNLMDLGDAQDAAERIGGSAGEALIADARQRRQTGLEMLITVQRGTPPTDHEVMMLGLALRILDGRPRSVSKRRGSNGTNRVSPVLADLEDVLRKPTGALKDAALWRGDDERYWHTVDPLLRTLRAMADDGGLGEVFARPSEVPIDRTRPVVFDLSGVHESDTRLRAAVLLACWTVGFGAIAISHAMADAGLEPRRTYVAVMDELWSALRAGTGLVDRVDSLGRLNRDKGVGTIMVSHTMDDLKALPTEQDRSKAAGLVERAGVLICAGLPQSEMERLATVARFTEREQAELVSWSTPPTWSSTNTARPPGQGKFLIKVGGRPGIPFELVLTPAEAALSNTNKRWAVGA